jgi:hypothetical protein
LFECFSDKTGGSAKGCKYSCLRLRSGGRVKAFWRRFDVVGLALSAPENFSLNQAKPFGSAAFQVFAAGRQLAF